MDHHVVIEHEPHAHVMHGRASRHGPAEDGFEVVRLAVYDPPLDLEQTVAPPVAPHVNAAKVKRPFRRARRRHAPRCRRSSIEARRPLLQERVYRLAMVRRLVADGLERGGELQDRVQARMDGLAHQPLGQTQAV
jgi:hypothetical protein